MHDERQGVDGLARQQDVQLHQLRGLVAVHIVVEGGIALRVRLQLVEEVQDELGQGYLPEHLHGGLGEVVHGDEVAAPAHSQIHHGAHVVGRDEDLRLQVGLLHVIDGAGVGHLLGRVERDHLAALQVDVVLHRGSRGQKVKPELALQALLDDLHVQKAQKAHAEAETEGMGGLGFPHEGRVVQGQLLQGLLQGLVLVAVDGEQAREHHGLRLAIAGQRRCHPTGGQGDGIAHLHLAHILEARDQIAHLAHVERLFGHLLGVAGAHFLYEGLGARGHHADLVALLDLAVHHADEGYHAAVGVEVAVEDEGAQGRPAVALGRRDVVDHGLQEVVDALAGLAAGEHRVVGRDGQAVLDLGLHPLRLGGRQVDLVDERDDLQIGVHGQHGVGYRLGLHALGGVHHEHRAVAGGQAAAHLVGEVHMARGVDEVQLVGLAVVGRVAHAHGLALDGDAALALDVHGIEQLGLHVALGHGARQLQDAVRERGLAVVDVGDDREVADMGQFVGHNGFLIAVGSCVCVRLTKIDPRRGYFLGTLRRIFGILPHCVSSDMHAR